MTESVPLKYDQSDDDVEITSHVNENIFTNFSVLTAYVCGLSFGFHLTALEIIKKLYFTGNALHTLKEYYVLASLLFISPLISSMLYNHINMKLNLWIGLVLLLHSISAIGLMMPYILVLYAFRCVAGVAVGLSTAVVPQYVSRLKKHRRGFFTFLFQVSILTGILIGQILSYYTSTVFLFRIIFAVFSFFNVMFAGMSFFIQKPAETETRRESRGITSLLAHKRHIKSVLLALCIHIGQQMTGINGIIVYSNTLLEENPGNPQMRTIFIGLFSLVVTLVSAAFVDVFGRKFLLLFSSTIVGASLILLTTKKYVLASVLAFQFGYSVGLGPITWLLTNELFPLNYLQAANSICVTTNWLCAFLVVIGFEYSYLRVGNALLWFYVCCMAVFTAIFFFYYNETKGKEPNFQ
ncbi:Major Facilitator Superfamily (MFS) [Trachipleistophora hominis]|uniref:Major Facilitator Superfamily (MFS) n=1 Tax=Trachipleistophora hominis TaxID=72359 RepID=L7JRN0_TRAHO|nr:Major Facilitator Superfamily (MFS) [Trachipleistophora hominis]